MSNLTRINKELAMAEKEFNYCHRKNIIAAVKVSTLSLLLSLSPYFLGGPLIIKNIYEAKFKEVTDKYLEEITVDSNGNETINYIDPVEKEDSYLKVYKDCMEHDGMYAVTYDLYTGDNINYDSYKVVSDNIKPIEEVLGRPVTIGTYSMDPVNVGGIETIVYKESDKEFKRKLRKDEQTYIDKKNAACGELMIASSAVIALSNLFTVTKFYSKIGDKFRLDETAEESREAYNKVKTLRRKRDIEFDKVDNGYLFCKNK